MNKPTFILMMLVLCLMVSSCMDIKQSYIPTEFYTLEYQPPDPQDREQLPYSIRVERFTTAPDMNSGRIIYRSGPFKRQAYIYHRWRSNPAETVRYLLSRDLTASGLFSAVFTGARNLSSSIAIEGVIDEFFEWDTGEETEAVITISVMVLAEQKNSLDRVIILQEQFTSRQPTTERSAPALVHAMSKAMSEVSTNLTNRIYEELLKASEEGKKQ